MELFKTPYQIDELSRHMLQDGHVLIAGCTGSGKSTVLNNFLYCLCHEHPNNYQYAIIDLKRVSLLNWEFTPHCKYYARDGIQANFIIKSTVATMNARFQAMEKGRIDKYGGTKLFLIIDEAADLIANNKTILNDIIEIMRKGRAANIVCVYATQDPSKKTIVAAIQQNVSLNIALRCRDAIASRQIIGESGAEFLPRYGKAIYYSPANMITKEVNVPLVPDTEIKRYLDEMTNAGYKSTHIKPPRKSKTIKFLKLIFSK